jgi:hypothetical protein
VDAGRFEDFAARATTRGRDSWRAEILLAQVADRDDT